MAHFTTAGGGNVVCIFADGDCIVMTVFTDIGSLIMSKRQYDWQPGSGSMTRLTCFTGQRVSSRFVAGAVTTTGDATGNYCLIMGKRENQGQPACFGMTALTQICGLRMIRSFA